MEKTPLFSLQIIRALAASMVFLLHAGIMPYGYIGVDIFFVLSGFIIFHTHFEYIGKTKHLKTYLYKRFIRIYPLYWSVCGIFILALLLKGGKISDFYQFSWFSFWQTFFLTFYHPSFLVVSWTLSYELYFYLLFSILFINRLFLGILMIVFLGSFLSLISKIYSFSFFTLSFPFSFLFNSLIIEFYIGIFIFYLYHYSTINLKKYFLFLFLSCILISFLPAYYFKSREILGGIIGFWVVLGALLIEKRYGFPSKNYLMNLLVRFGNASYFLYIAHSLMMGIFGSILLQLENRFHFWFFSGNFGLYFKIIFIHFFILFLSEKIEQPILRFLRVIFKSNN
ncbi:MAG: acyltransferase [Cytophagia bacterium]|nr:MAG: acyltransferase [Cytophagia bacterium]TAG42354.1 MAG: acyltransferase [Cytophagia bacterium]